MIETKIVGIPAVNQAPELQIPFSKLILLITNYAEHFIIEKRVARVVNLCDLSVNQAVITGIKRWSGLSIVR